MLGAIKGDEADDGAPLFRVLARRWKPVVPVREPRLLATRPGEDSSVAARAWIGKPRPRYAAVIPPVADAKPAKTWSPWLWMK